MENFVAGFMALMNFNTILFMLIGTVAGLIIGALPGLTGNMAIALMVPVTFSMEPTSAIAFLVAPPFLEEHRREVRAKELRECNIQADADQQRRRQ